MVRPTEPPLNAMAPDVEVPENFDIDACRSVRDVMRSDVARRVLDLFNRRRSTYVTMEMIVDDPGLFEQVHDFAMGIPWKGTLDHLRHISSWLLQECRQQILFRRTALNAGNQEEADERLDGEFDWYASQEADESSI